MKKHQNPPRDYSVRKLEAGPLGGLYVEVNGARLRPDGTWYIENEVPEFFMYGLTGFDAGAETKLVGRDDTYAEALDAAKTFAKQLGASLDDRYDREHPWQPGEWERALTSSVLK